MKKIFKVFLLTLMVSSSIVIVNETKAQGVSVSFSVFQNSLRPYGRWMNNSSYGQVWVSNDRNFVPYQTNGHWAYTDYGWTWVSDYDWGWAPFHYGRWSYTRSYGWYWVPGYEWSPAWVAWRNNDDYYGWAPLSPGLNVSVGVSFGNIAYGRWTFAPRRYITSPDIRRYYEPRQRNVTIIKNTTVINNVTVKNNVRYDGGPRREDVERVTHTKVQTLTVANSDRPGKTVVNNKTVNIYKPTINKNETVINKNSNNTTINKNSNNKTTVNKDNNNKTVVNKNNNNDKTTVNKNSNNKDLNKNNDGNKNNNLNRDNSGENKKDKVNKKPASEKTKPANNNNKDNMRPPQKKQQQQKPKQDNKPPKQNQ